MAVQSWLSQIRNARSYNDQACALRDVKNAVIGHPLKKESIVELGVLDTIVRMTSNKNDGSQDGKCPEIPLDSRSTLNGEETVRLQGLQVLTSLAIGGPPFLAPLHACSALPAILSNLCPTNNPWQLVLASLRALSNLADAAALDPSTQAISTSTIADAVFSRQNIRSINDILAQTSATSYSHNQISLLVTLISRLCQEERHQQALANSGVLDALATKLASFIVAEGLVIPGAEISARREGIEEHIPAAANSSWNIAFVLEAIAIIIADSKCRAAQLLYSPSILATLPLSKPVEFSGTQNARAAWNAFNAAGLGERQNQLNNLNAIEYLLPWVPVTQVKSASSHAAAFPPLGSSGSREQLALNGYSSRHKYSSGFVANWKDVPGENVLGEDVVAPEATAPDSDPDSPFVTYLIYLVRSRNGLTRLMAASVLTHLHRSGLALKNKENPIALLVVPLLVTMLDDPIVPVKGRDPYADEEAVLVERAIKERAPAVLSMLITDSEALQKAAYDASVVNKLSKLLKVSYDPVIDLSNPPTWSPESPRGDVDAPRLGSEGQSPILVHKIKVREATLKAIAALVPFKDDYRKAIVDNGMMPYIIESMNPTPSKPSQKSNDKIDKKVPADTEIHRGYGINSINVLVAACGAVRALSRSVSVLRTTLIDNGVAEPVFRLLSHSDIEVQVAATACACNLLTDVSPMRESFHEAGVLKILCEHARSTNAKLRLNALWALKHFVHGVNNDMKRQCVEELGQGWLVQLICDDTENQALHSSSGNVDRIHTPVDDINEDVEMESFEEAVDSAFKSSFCAPTSRPTTSRSRSKSVQQAELRLAALRDEETNPIRKARKDDIAVQEQGLDFIRNLISGAQDGGAATTEMIDFLFQSLGQDRIFEILISKLKPKVVNPYNRRHTQSDTKIIPPRTEIIIAIAYIMVHMAASVPRHRQLVIAQTDLLKLLVPQFNHHSIEIRLALCWLCTNLTWRNDSSDTAACSQRVAELKKLGFLGKLEMLEADPELNVRERAKSALYQMRASERERND